MAAPFLIPGIIAGAGALASGVTSLVGGNKANKANIKLQREQNQWNEKQARQANEWNIQQWDRENAYNSPLQQMQRLENAGLNPNLLAGNPGSGGTASQLKSNVPQSVAPARVTNTMQQISNQIMPMISMFQDLQNRSAQLTVQQKQAQVLDQEIAGRALDNIAKGYTNQKLDAESGFYPYMAEARYLKTSHQSYSAKYDKLAKQLNLGILEQTAPNLVERATYIARDVKQRALRGELELDMSRNLRPFGMTSSDQLWQRKLVPILEQFLMKNLFNKNNLYQLSK